MSMKYCPFPYAESQNKNGQDFLDMHLTSNVDIIEEVIFGIYGGTVISFMWFRHRPSAKLQLIQERILSVSKFAANMYCVCLSIPQINT